MYFSVLGEWVMHLHGIMWANNLHALKPIGPAAYSWGQGGHVDFTKEPPNWQTGTSPNPVERPVLSGFNPSAFPASGQNQNVGSYPRAELGRITFALEFPAAFPPDQGLVSGSLAGNTGGIAPGRANFKGGYKFQAGSDRDGVFSIQFMDPGFENHIWDYLFTILSFNEIAVISGNQFPRPAVVSGTLRRIGPYMGYQPFPEEQRKPQ